MQDPLPKITHLSAYRAPLFTIDTMVLRFELADHSCVVDCRLSIQRSKQGHLDHHEPLILDGQELELLSLAIDGRELEAAQYHIGVEHLTVYNVPAQFTLDVRTRIEPHNNTSLEGLYRSGEMYCTQCEAEGFRKITYHLDRPDVMARYSTTIVADARRYPVLLSNGNCTGRGLAEDGRHWATWEDPFPKPSYLFALVAGNLVCAEDSYATRSGRTVSLQIFVEPHNVGKSAHAMASLKRAMRWDEEVYGLEYDLDIFMIVAVDSFNMGAMENKGLNVFNSKYVLADAETATDSDFKNIESIIAHEYFHNWTGNRVTCRDWFQLSLKEGLTVFRDQEFSADVGSPALTRISDVRVLRTAQFKEDAGPTAHPVRPSSYLEINNFYTVTVYNKGAEVVRMIHTLLGPERFRAGMDRYFERHDGQAVTTDDFVGAMESVSDLDLTQFRRWYTQAGTPVVKVATHYDPGASRYTITLSQHCDETPDGSPKEPFHIPIAVGLITSDGQSIAITDDPKRPHTKTLELTEPQQSYSFDGIPAQPVASVLRAFSAPTRLDFPRADHELAFLLGSDPDSFNRWDAAQEYSERLMLRAIPRWQAGHSLQPDNAYLDAVGAVLSAPDLDRALAAEMLTLPAESYIAERMHTVDPDAIHAVRRWLRRSIAQHLHSELEATYGACKSNAPYAFEVGAVANRMLKNVALGYLMECDSGAEATCESQFDGADNMTDRIAALGLLSLTDTAARTRSLATFEKLWQHDPLVLDKWFTLQATSPLSGAIRHVKALMNHRGYDGTNPNRVRSLIGAFCQGNQVRFHAASGEGYEFLGDQLITLDRLNPQIAARLAGGFLRWRKFDRARQTLMETQIQRVLASPGLSKDCLEILSKTLKAPASPAPHPSDARNHTEA